MRTLAHAKLMLECQRLLFPRNGLYRLFQYNMQDLPSKLVIYCDSFKIMNWYDSMCNIHRAWFPIS